MKRLSKQEMMDILGTLQKANRLSTTPGISAQQLVDILTKCQGSAINMGEALERYGEVGEQVIHMLEEYCEALYMQSQHIGNVQFQKEFQSGIATMLDLMEDKIQKELPPDKKVVVFLPYKASMWDSLESVWEAAEADPDCDAYVVPIPYFDKNPDMTLGEMHYEGNDYPANVPIYSWEEFPLPDMKPDTIFIHNPYDELNYISSVHPAFYSSELKKYTKELVYIPYFVLQEERSIATSYDREKMEAFVLVPGVVNATKVIVQSEHIKQLYVDILSETFGEDHRFVWEKKILPLGSPKFDKVAKTEKENLELPPEWLPVLTKEDGSFKKVILYNTSITTLVEKGERYLAKLRNVLQTFHENHDEVALLWRPHPLFLTTLQARFPELVEEYTVMVEGYKSDGWGIYDDTPDMNRAIALADAYYGDGSSLIQLCQEKGMPVMVQDVEMIV